MKGILRSVVTFAFALLFLGHWCLGQQPDNLSQHCPPDGSDPKAECRNPSQKPEPLKETVVVTGTYTPTPLEDVDRSVDVIDAKDAPLLFNNWVNLVQLDPSIDLQERAPGDVQTDLTIRGSTFGQTLVMVDGLRMNDVQSGHHNMDLPLPTAAISRIEVLRGAGSTLYGSDAMAGSINLITAPASYSELRLGSAIGNFGINQETGSAGLLHGRWNESLDVERDFSSGFRPDRDYRSLTIFSDGGMQTALGASRLLLAYGDKPFGADQFYGNFDSWERTKSWFAGFKQDLGKKTEFDFAFRRHTDEFVLFREDPAAFENNHIDKSWQTALRRKEQLSPNLTFFYGGEGFHESIDSNNLGIHDRSHGAVYADFDVRAWRRFSFSLGAREEILSSSHGEFSPTIAAGVWLKAGLKLKGSVSRAFRLPTYTDLYYHDPATLGNPNLQSESAWDYEGGLVWDQGGHYKAEVTVFQRREHNDIDYVKANPADLWQAANIAQLNFTGVETSWGVRLPRDQGVNVSYTYLYGAQQALNGLLSEYIFNYPNNNAVVSWNGLLPGRFMARTRVGAVSRYARTPYGLWDVGVARQFNHVAAHLDLANITDTQYEEIPGVIMPGRSVVFGLELYFSKHK